MGTLIIKALLLLAMISPESKDAHMEALKSFPKAHQVATELFVNLELLDEREKRYVFNKHEELECDTTMMVSRYNSLKNAPKLQDHIRFNISRNTINDLVRFNRSFNKYCESQIPFNLDRAGQYQAAMKECNQLYEVWDVLRDSKCEFYYIHIRRTALNRYKQLMGEEAYNNGELPEYYVPSWRFREIK